MKKVISPPVEGDFGGREDPELLTDLSHEELIALANTQLAPTTQSQLSDLLERNQHQQLTPEETATLDQLLSQVDLLNSLKTRARYTLNYSETP